MKENKCTTPQNPRYMKRKIKFGVAYARNPIHEKWGIPEFNAFTTSTWCSFF